MWTILVYDPCFIRVRVSIYSYTTRYTDKSRGEPILLNYENRRN